MDNNGSVLRLEPRRSEFAGFRLLERLDPANIDPLKLKWLWERIEECEESFDDFTRGNVDFFLMQFGNSLNEFYLVEDEVLVMIMHPIERGSADIHYLTWKKERDLSKYRQIAREAFDYVFFERGVHRVTGMIPAYNQAAIRFALSVGMKFEGEIRENYLYHGEYYATEIYGMLESEYPEVRWRLK